MLMTVLSLAVTTVTRIQENISCRVLSLHLLRPDQRRPAVAQHAGKGHTLAVCSNCWDWSSFCEILSKCLTILSRYEVYGLVCQVYLQTLTLLERHHAIKSCNVCNKLCVCVMFVMNLRTSLSPSFIKGFITRNIILFVALLYVGIENVWAAVRGLNVWGEQRTSHQSQTLLVFIYGPSPFHSIGTFHWQSQCNDFVSKLLESSESGFLQVCYVVAIVLFMVSTLQNLTLQPGERSAFVNQLKFSAEAIITTKAVVDCWSLQAAVKNVLYRMITRHLERWNNSSLFLNGTFAHLLSIYEIYNV